MNFLNLSLGELLGVAGAISAGVVALYLLDRSKRRQVVATLRFWTAADSRTEMKHRKRIQQPWSLLLQLLSLLFLVIALAGPRLGPEDSGRDHVLILDTSAWMGARAGRTTLMDEARVAAHGDTGLFIGCPDVDAAYEELRARGVDVKKPHVAAYGMKQMSLRDPDGYGLCFQWEAKR